jgi:hypothetical protein
VKTDTKPRRFFFHYNKPANLAHRSPKLSIHWLGSCRIVDKIECQVPTESKINKRQPKVVMQGFANHITIVTEVNGTQTAQIQNLRIIR